MPTIEELRGRRHDIIVAGLAHQADEGAWSADVVGAIRRDRELLAELDEVEAELQHARTRPSSRAHRSPTPPRRRPQPTPEAQPLAPVEVDLPLAARLCVELEER